MRHARKVLLAALTWGILSFSALASAPPTDDRDSQHVTPVISWATLKTNPHASLLAPWKTLLKTTDAQDQHLAWAQDVLKTENIERLRKNGLLQQITAIPDKQKALALAASATEIFTNEMNTHNQHWIIETALEYSGPLSGMGQIGAACKSLFTEQMDGEEQCIALTKALKSARLPLADIKILRIAYKILLERCGHFLNHCVLLAHSLSLSVEEIDELMEEYKTESPELFLNNFLQKMKTKK